MTEVHPLVARYLAINPGRDHRKRDLMSFFRAHGCETDKDAWDVLTTMRRGSKVGYYTAAQVATTFAEPTHVKTVVTDPFDPLVMPTKNPVYVKWGNYGDLRKIIQSQMFYPVYVAGLSGNGKTMMIEQACAELKRAYVRVQCTPETDENDLLGGYRLQDGNTIFEKGPVVRAMEAGAICILDEIDRGTNKMMALQGVMEGKPVLLKKTGEVVYPRPGFNVIATANTKGRGSDDGKFVAASIIDEAFLERFTIVLDQPYPPAAVETVILAHLAELFGLAKADTSKFITDLVKWSEAIRATYAMGKVDEVVSTRRLCQMVQTLAIFNNETKAVKLGLARFDDDTRDAFFSLYRNITGNTEIEEDQPEESA